jgi:hypothetical protein
VAWGERCKKKKKTKKKPTPIAYLFSIDYQVNVANQQPLKPDFSFLA